MDTSGQNKGYPPALLRYALATYQLASAGWVLFYDHATLFARTRENLPERTFAIALLLLSILAGIYLLRSPLLGRTFTVLSQAPQVIGIASPSFTWNAHYIFAVLFRLSGTKPDAGPGTGTFSADAAWHWGSTFELAYGTPHLNHPGYTFSLNALALTILLAVLFWRQKAPR